MQNYRNLFKKLIAACLCLAIIAGTAGCSVIEKYMPGKDKEESKDTSKDRKRERRNKSEEVEEVEIIDPEVELQNQINEIIAEMTLEEKVAQMFMITPEMLTGVGTVVSAGETSKTCYDLTPVGGLIYFSQNLNDENQTKEMISGMQAISEERIGLPLLIAVDEEGGTVTRINGKSGFNTTYVGDMADVGATGDPQNAYVAGVQIGSYLATCGFNVDFAPVADVLLNPQNVVVQRRSFGSDPEMAAQMAAAFSNGLMEQGVLPTYKHFPGHGGTAGDTHAGYAYTNETLDELRANDLVPYKEAINNGLSIVMVGHISTPNATGNDLPATLSYDIVTGLLREELGFEGIAITDAMQMGAITSQYSSGDAAIMAIEAGIDMILIPMDFVGAYQAVIDAVRNGVIPEERIDESLRRIVRVKLTLQQ